MNDFVSGAIAVLSLLAGLFFLRFWKDTRDRLFLYFALAFGLMAVQRVVLSLTSRTVEDLTPLYVLRLISYLLILAAIVDKNRKHHD